jgi:hypothetical protein
LDFLYFVVNLDCPVHVQYRCRFWCFPSGTPEFTPAFSWVRVTRSLVLCVCFVDRCFSFSPYSFGLCVVCYSSIYGFWLPLWYLQTLLSTLLGSFLQDGSKLYLLLFLGFRTIFSRLMQYPLSIVIHCTLSNLTEYCNIMIIWTFYILLWILIVQCMCNTVVDSDVCSIFAFTILAHLFVLSAILRITDFDYPFGIFKLFFLLYWRMQSGWLLLTCEAGELK